METKSNAVEQSHSLRAPKRDVSTGNRWSLTTATTPCSPDWSAATVSPPLTEAGERFVRQLRKTRREDIGHHSRQGGQDLGQSFGVQRLLSR